MCCLKMPSEEFWNIHGKTLAIQYVFGKRSSKKEGSIEVIFSGFSEEFFHRNGGKTTDSKNKTKLVKYAQSWEERYL